MNDFYIYQHRRNDTREVFYIGKGSGVRAYEIRHRSIYWNNIVNKCGYTVEILEDNISENVAFQKEIELIKSIGRKDLGLGPLVNLSNGGEGQTGRVMAQTTKNKLSKIHTGKTLSQETKDKISKANTGRTLSQKTKNNMSNAKSIPVINDLGEIFKSLSKAADAYGMKSPTGIHGCCTGRNLTAGGRSWQYYKKEIL